MKLTKNLALILVTFFLFSSLSTAQEVRSDPDGEHIVARTTTCITAYNSKDTKSTLINVRQTDKRNSSVIRENRRNIPRRISSEAKATALRIRISNLFSSLRVAQKDNCPNR